jgi:hypothetical protein
MLQYHSDAGAALTPARRYYSLKQADILQITMICVSFPVLAFYLMAQNLWELG